MKRINNNSLAICTLVAACVLSILLPIAITKLDFGIEFNDKTGPIGDTIGGIVGPVLNFAGMVLIYLSFRIQNETFISETKKNENKEWLKLSEYLITGLEKEIQRFCVKDIQRVNNALTALSPSDSLHECEGNLSESDVAELNAPTLEKKLRTAEWLTTLLANRIKQIEERLAEKGAEQAFDKTYLVYLWDTFYQVIAELESGFIKFDFLNSPRTALIQSNAPKLYLLLTAVDRVAKERETLICQLS